MQKTKSFPVDACPPIGNELSISSLSDHQSAGLRSGKEDRVLLLDDIPRAGTNPAGIILTQTSLSVISTMSWVGLLHNG